MVLFIVGLDMFSWLVAVFLRLPIVDVGVDLCCYLLLDWWFLYVGLFANLAYLVL